MGFEAAAGEGVEGLPLERLEVELTSLAGQVAAVTCRWLLAVAVYDRREGWGSWGCRSMVQWLGWKCGIAPSTAREQVRVARALEKLALVVAEFEAGRLSYSQVRAITRVATSATEGEWCAWPGRPRPASWSTWWAPTVPVAGWARSRPRAGTAGGSCGGGWMRTAPC